MTLVFVYGTLKGLKTRFGPGAAFQKSEFIGHAVTKDLFNLVDGVYPIAIHHDDAKARAKHNGVILGEVYAVGDAALKALDSYEGYPHLYTRATYPVVLKNGSKIDAWIYTGRDARYSIGKQGRAFINPDSEGRLYWPFDSEIPFSLTG